MLETMLVFTICLLTLILSSAPIQPVNCSEETQQQPSESNLVRKRSYSPWPGASSLNSLSLYNAGQVFKAPTYSLSRPYYIPVYGAAGGNLLFYPPQPVYLNAGAPKDNPVRPPPPYQGPAYLPPKETSTQMTMNRFGEDNDEDDAPVWGNAGAMGQNPLSNDDQNKEWAVSPTRPPMASLPSRPPLVRNDQAPETVKASAAGAADPVTPGPSNCVWAIISCCSASSPTLLPQNCFEQRGCPGPFWGESPCQGDFARAAIASAVNYYSSNPGVAPGK